MWPVKISLTDGSIEKNKNKNTTTAQYVCKAPCYTLHPIGVSLRLLAL